MKDSQAQSIANKTTENDASTVKHLTADEQKAAVAERFRKAREARS